MQTTSTVESVSRLPRRTLDLSSSLKPVGEFIILPSSNPLLEVARTARVHLSCVKMISEGIYIYCQSSVCAHIYRHFFNNQILSEQTYILARWKTFDSKSINFQYPIIRDLIFAWVPTQAVPRLGQPIRLPPGQSIFITR